ncbi:hypothetical protein [Aeromicrobium sp. Leaf350]|uniref:hypothetical protein n=1 Tax=Aeromicrobium sp. Leaf350 TaxID=2876565 RepID=UPI001E3203E8|nr:hypothetical protein [Aeromicrobium sp. Leaf350]
MAKALMGHLGGPTPAQLHQTALLKRRVADLEAEVLRLKIENDGLLKALHDQVDAVTTADLLEPVSH